MIPSLSNLTTVSDLVVVGRVGVITSTGGSINVEINVDKVLKGSLRNTKIRIILSTKEAAPSSELNPGKLYIFFLRPFQGDESTVYTLAGNDPNVVIPFNDEAFNEIQTLLSSKDVD